jgi:hypothetical protein
MKDFIQKLPFDIVLRIIPYTYNIQQNSLLNDIVNFTQVKTILYELYYNYWMIEMQVQDPEEDKNWLINDILGYANNNNAIIFGYVDNFYNIFKRNIVLKTKTKEEIKKYVKNIYNKEVISQINIFLGLFTIHERNELIYNFYLENGVENNM